MANEIIDFGFLATKVATLNNDSAKMAVDSVSLVYNAAQIANFRNSIAEYQQILGHISLHAQLYGVTPQKLDIATQCKNGIDFCQTQINKGLFQTLRIEIVRESGIRTFEIDKEHLPNNKTNTTRFYLKEGGEIKWCSKVAENMHEVR